MADTPNGGKPGPLCAPGCDVVAVLHHAQLCTIIPLPARGRQSAGRSCAGIDHPAALTNSQVADDALGRCACCDRRHLHCA
jgi:hypothetical protein